MIGMAFGAVTWGLMSDHYTQKKLLSFGLGAYIFTTLSCWTCEHIHSFYFVRFIQGLTVTVCSVSALVLVRTLFTGTTERTKAQSRVSMAMALSPALGPIIGMYFSQGLFWKYIFFFFSAFALFVLYFAYQTLPDCKISKKTCSSWSNYTQVLMDRQLIYNSALTGICIGNAMSFFTLSAYYYTEFYHLNEKMIFLIYIPVSIAFIIGGSLSEKISDYISCNSGVQIGATIAALFSFLPYATQLAANSPSNTMLLISLVSVMCMMIGTGLIIPRTITRALDKHQHHPGLASSIMSCVYYIVAGVITYLAGHIFQENLFYFHRFFCILNLILLLSCHTLVKSYAKAYST